MVVVIWGPSVSSTPLIHRESKKYLGRNGIDRLYIDCFNLDVGISSHRTKIALVILII